MRNNFTVFFLILFFLTSCGSKEEVVSKWRVLDEEEYAPEIDQANFRNSLDELEKLIYAPVSYFISNGGVHSFKHTLQYKVETPGTEENEARTLILDESSSYQSDSENNFSMQLQNNKNEGWEIVWKDNFLYRKQFGGEFTKTVSMGEHRSMRDNIFKAIPSIYTILRENAEIESEKAWKVGSQKGYLVTVRFSDSQVKRSPLPEKRYLQNLQGTEEMKDDSMIKSFAGKKKRDIKGTLTLFFPEQTMVIAEMKMDLGFAFADENVSFEIHGRRTMSNELSEIKEPVYNEEYHRRTLDSSVNIMKKDEKKGKVKDDKKE
ncbi:hypothetical protein J5834_06050 [bacterium]|nr:hypothetical protein [bacterium]